MLGITASEQETLSVQTALTKRLSVFPGLSATGLIEGVWSPVLCLITPTSLLPQHLHSQTFPRQDLVCFFSPSNPWTWPPTTLSISLLPSSSSFACTFRLALRKKHNLSSGSSQMLYVIKVRLNCRNPNMLIRPYILASLHVYHRMPDFETHPHVKRLVQLRYCTVLSYGVRAWRL